MTGSEFHPAHSSDGGATAPLDVAPRGSLEKSQLNVGIIPLTDCAVIVAAKEKGYFARQGLDVRISREASWAAIRDKLAAGVLDAAHMLAGIPIAAALGIEALDCPMVTAISLDLNGNAFTVSKALHREMETAGPISSTSRDASVHGLRIAIEQRKARGQPPLTFAVVHPFSSHNYQLRYWLAVGGIHPGSDVRLVVVPPPRMVEQLETGRIDGFCAGEPWNALAVRRDLGRTIVTGYDIWRNAPEKVLGVTQAWADAHPQTHRALVRALMEAARWADEPEHRLELASMIVERGYVDVPLDVMRLSLTGKLLTSPDGAAESLPDYHVFHRYAATFPWRSHAIWFIAQMIRWGDLDRRVDVAGIARRVYMSEVYREAARELGVPVPTVDMKDEGIHKQAWHLPHSPGAIVMGADQFCDGVPFMPAQPLDGVYRAAISAIAPAWQQGAPARCLDESAPKDAGSALA